MPPCLQLNISRSCVREQVPVDVPDKPLSQRFQGLHSGLMHAGMVARSGKIGANVTEWKLVDVPELGYSTTDKPFPRGELHIKTKAMIPRLLQAAEGEPTPSTVGGSQ